MRRDVGWTRRARSTLSVALLVLGPPAAARAGGDPAVVLSEESLSITGMAAEYGPEDPIGLEVTVPRAGVLRARVEIAVLRDDREGRPLFQELREYDRYGDVRRLRFSVDLPAGQRRGILVLLARVRGVRAQDGGAIEPFESAVTYRLRFAGETLSAVEGTRLSGRVLFAFDSAALDVTAERTVDEWARTLRATSGVGEIRVEGHADRVGGSNYNLQLSRRRAEVVRDALVTRGVDGERLRVLGFGFERPRAARDGADAARPGERGVQDDRRAEVVWFAADPDPAR